MIEDIAKGLFLLVGGGLTVAMLVMTVRVIIDLWRNR